jgi:transcriptional regulator with XRE-family HTH domain
MESQTVREGLQHYGIGGKLRRLRLRKSMGLIELGKHTGLSPALLSKLERDVMRPTLPTLLRIALAFSVGLDYFFVPEPKPVFEIIRKRDRLRFPDLPDAKKVSYYFESLDFAVPQRALNSYLAEFEPIETDDVRLHQHPGIESLFVISGRLQIHFQDAIHELREKDAVYFDSTVWHGYRRIGPRHCSALVATVES